MMMDEDGQVAKPDLYAHPSDDELHRLSVDDLGERISWLEGEIERTRLVLNSKKGAFSDAEAFFKK